MRPHFAVFKVDFLPTDTRPAGIKGRGKRLEVVLSTLSRYYPFFSWHGNRIVGFSDADIPTVIMCYSSEESLSQEAAGKGETKGRPTLSHRIVSSE